MTTPLSTSDQGMPLLRTKLYIPPLRSEQVPRPRLIERLDAGLDRKLALISAPAGFGKTTLVSEWVASHRRGGPRLEAARAQGLAPLQVAWLSLDEGDNDLTRFLTYLVAALQAAHPGGEADVGQGALGALLSPQPPPVETILATLINEVAALPDKIVLVLDDYHLIEAQAVHDAVAFLLRHLPPAAGLYLVIATRDDPPLPLARLRARRQLTELRATDLRFTPSEAVVFLNQVMGLDLSAEEIAALERRTEGWIAGLQLAALAMQGALANQGRANAASFVQSFAGGHRFVMDYLVEEVLKQQPQEIQAFLLQTAVLDRLTGDLCDAVRFGDARSPNPSEGTATGQETLEMLERANLFIVPLDDERRWYRYHHLFADLIRQRLRHTHPEELPTFHTRAGQWFKGQGLNREAIKHFLAARAYQGAAELIGAIAIDIMQQGEHTTVVGWIDALPEGFVREQPYLCVLHAWALQLTGQLESAQARLTDAENALQGLESPQEGDADTILGLVHSHRAYIAFMTGEHDKTIAYAHQALDRLPETAALIRAQTALYLGVAYRFRGQLQAALEVYDEILPITQTMGGKSIAVLCYLHVGDLHAEMTQLHRAKELYEQALQSTERHAGRPEMPFSGYVYVSIGRILREWNQLEEAYRLTTKGLALCRDWNVADILALSCIEWAYVCQALEKEGQARASMQEAIQVYASFSAWGIQYASAHQAKLNLQRGELDAAARWAQGNDLAIGGEFQFHREVDYLVLVRVYMAQKRFEQAHALAQRIVRVAQEAGKRQTELEGLVLLACVFDGRGETDQALAHLEQALSIAEPEGYVRLFVDEGPPMAHLLYEAVSRGIMPDYASQLLAAFPDVKAPPQKHSQIPKSEIRTSELLEPLSEREREVLHLIAQGLTNPEIAARLYLSLNTVKAHTRNIYGKLDVHSRTQAVARARALGILKSQQGRLE
jgi:LuxR family maltose regulon positive regulatory protein